MIKRIVSSLIFISFSANAQVAQQRQGQEQGQRQDIIFAGKTESAAARAFAIAPSVFSKCTASAAAGGQGSFFGFSFSGTYKDEFCERIELIKLAIAMGHYDVADALFYSFPMILALHPEEKRKACKYPTETNCEKR